MAAGEGLPGRGNRAGMVIPLRRDGYSLVVIVRGWASILVAGSLLGAVSDGGAGGEATSGHGSRWPAPGTQTLP